MGIEKNLGQDIYTTFLIPLESDSVSIAAVKQTFD